MKKISLVLCFFIWSTLNAFSQNIPINFETGGFGANWAWNVFENGNNPALQFVDNPDTTGINCSKTCAKFTALQIGKPWAGCETQHNTGIGSFTINANNKIIKIMVYKGVISDVGIKLVRNDNWSLGEIKKPNTLINQWEMLTFDFSAHMGNTYDQIVVFPDFNLAGRPEEQVIYFDNIYQNTAIPCNTSTANIGSGLQQSINNRCYPNPSNGQITLESNEQISKVLFYDVCGRVLLEIPSHTSTKQIDLNAYLNKGLYFINYVDKEGYTIEKQRFIFDGNK
jgi:hypothetical protein